MNCVSPPTPPTQVVTGPGNQPPLPSAFGPECSLPVPSLPVMWFRHDDRATARLCLFRSDCLESGRLPAFLEVTLLHSGTQASFVPAVGRPVPEWPSCSVQKKIPSFQG